MNDLDFLFDMQMDELESRHPDWDMLDVIEQAVRRVE